MGTQKDLAAMRAIIDATIEAIMDERARCAEIVRQHLNEGRAEYGCATLDKILAQIEKRGL